MQSLLSFIIKNSRVDYLLFFNTIKMDINSAGSHPTFALAFKCDWAGEILSQTRKLFACSFLLEFVIEFLVHAYVSCIRH